MQALSFILRVTPEVPVMKDDKKLANVEVSENWVVYRKAGLSSWRLELLKTSY